MLALMRSVLTDVLASSAAVRSHDRGVDGTYCAIRRRLGIAPSLRQRRRQATRCQVVQC